MRAVYEIYIDNLRKGITNQRELDSLENGMKQMYQTIQYLEIENQRLSNLSQILINGIQGQINMLSTANIEDGEHVMRVNHKTLVKLKNKLEELID